MKGAAPGRNRTKDRARGPRIEPKPIRCALDLLDTPRQPLTQIELADLFGVTRQRIQQIEVRAMAKLIRACQKDVELRQIFEDMSA